MSAQHVDLVRTILDRWRDGDLTVRRGEFDRDFALERPDEPGASTLYGLEGLAEGWREWIEPFEGWHFEIQELIDAGDQVVALLRMWARGRGSDAEIEMRGAHLYSFRDGRITRLGWYARQADALNAAGLPSR